MTIPFVNASQAGTLAERPATDPNKIGRFYSVTSGVSTGNLYRDSGAGWDLITRSLSNYDNVVVVDAGGNGDYTNFSDAQSAISALTSGGVVLVFSGDYTISTSILLPSHVALRGAGNSTRITLANSSNCDMITNSDWVNGNTGIVVEYLYLDGNRTNQSSAVGDGPGQSLISLVNVSHSVVRDVHGTSPFLHGLDLNVRDSAANSYGDPGCTDCVIDNCHFTDFGDDGISPHWSSRIVISNCVCWAAAATYSGSSNGVECDDGSHDITITDCIAYDCVNGFMVQGHSSRNGAINISFSGCLSYSNANTGWLISKSTPAGTDVPRNVTLNGCISTGNPTGFFLTNYQNVSINGCISDGDTQPLRLTGDIALATRAIEIDDCVFYGGGAINLNDTDVRDVTFSGCLFRASTGTYAIVVAIPGVSISNCTISDNTHGGIQVTAAGTGCRLIGNTIYGNNDTGLMFGGANGIVSNNSIYDNTSRGLYLYPAADNIIISGNRIWWSGAGAPHTQSYGIRVENVAGIVSIYNNNLAGNGTAGAQIVAGNGSAVRWRNNVGFSSENNGTATVVNGATYVDVSHGMSLTPGLDDIMVIATNNLGNADRFWITDAGASTFRINVNADPGAGTATFAWSVQIL